MHCFKLKGNYPLKSNASRTQRALLSNVYAKILIIVIWFLQIAKRFQKDPGYGVV
jgi:hypothetical protein